MLLKFSKQLKIALFLFCVFTLSLAKADQSVSSKFLALEDARGVFEGRALQSTPLLLADSRVGVATPQKASFPKDVQWVKKSAEYAALCVQTYRAAEQAVGRLARQEKGNWVVVLDVDETVMDNSQYQIELNLQGAEFSPDSWAAWVNRKEAGAIPGAKAFLDSVRSLGPKAHVAFITNREASLESSTIENMKRLGLFQDGDIMLGRAGKEDTKEMRRQCLRSGTGRCENYGPLPIVALVGDQLRDFVEVTKPEEIRELREKIETDPAWGQRYFMLPNPMYGDWNKLP